MDFWMEVIMDLMDAVVVLSSVASTVIVFYTARIAIGQLKEMNRTTEAQAFSTVVSVLQTPEVRKSRQTLMRINQPDFSKWEEAQIEAAETACNTYDVVGIMLRRSIIDPTMVTENWRTSIVRCWENALPMITTYRSDRGSDYWDDFEWLYNLSNKAASNTKPSFSLTQDKETPVQGGKPAMPTTAS
jgi:hypothetical protein